MPRTKNLHTASIDTLFEEFVTFFNGGPNNRQAYIGGAKTHALAFFRQHMITPNNIAIPGKYSKIDTFGFMDKEELSERQNKFSSLQQERIDLHKQASKNFMAMLDAIEEDNEKADRFKESMRASRLAFFSDLFTLTDDMYQRHMKAIRKRVEDFVKKKVRKMETEKQKVEKSYEKLLGVVESVKDKLDVESYDPSSNLHTISSDEYLNTVLGNDALLAEIFKFLTCVDVMTFRAASLNCFLAVSRLPIHFDIAKKLDPNIRGWLKNCFSGNAYSITFRAERIVDIEFMKKFLSPNKTLDGIHFLPNYAMSVSSLQKKYDMIQEMVKRFSPYRVTLNNYLPSFEDNSLKSISFNSNHPPIDKIKDLILSQKDSLTNIDIKGNVSAELLESLTQCENLKYLGCPFKLHLTHQRGDTEYQQYWNVLSSRIQYLTLHFQGYTGGRIFGSVSALKQFVDGRKQNSNNPPLYELLIMHPLEDCSYLRSLSELSDIHRLSLAISTDGLIGFDSAEQITKKISATNLTVKLDCMDQSTIYWADVLTKFFDFSNCISVRVIYSHMSMPWFRQDEDIPQRKNAFIALPKYFLENCPKLEKLKCDFNGRVTDVNILFFDGDATNESLMQELKKFKKNVQIEMLLPHFRVYCRGNHIPTTVFNEETQKKIENQSGLTYQKEDSRSKIVIDMNELWRSEHAKRKREDDDEDTVVHNLCE